MSNEKLEQIWDVVTGFFGGFARGVEQALTSLFGSSNARYIEKQLKPQVQAINELESRYEAMTDEELREQTALFRKRLAAGETLDDILVEAFAVCREGGKRFLGMRHYDVQLMGGMVLHSGNIAEMVTGEGKTLVATLPSYLNALEGKGVHVITVNDYLARRDMEWMGPLHMGLGLTVGAIQAGMDSGARQKAYRCDITYGTNNEFGFDYLRDNMRPAAPNDNRYEKNLQQAQGPLNYAIIDEVDNILIDEARTPLIISGPAHDDITKYSKADRIARQLKRDVHFEVNEKDHTAHMTEEGVRHAEKLADVESFYTAGNMQWPHLIDNSLKAHHLYRRDVNYVVNGDEVVIVDEFTGRLMPGRNWSDGLHQAVEAKEGVRIKEESQTLATITLQNFFKLYKKISGMTGTAMTEAGEFLKIYNLEVVAMPTNRHLERIIHPDVIYLTEKDKFKAIAEEVEDLSKWDVLEMKNGEHLRGRIKKEDDTQIEFLPKEARAPESIPQDRVKGIQRRGRPVLIGTVSIEKSERIADLLSKRGIKHAVLNAKHHMREADIISQAGRRGAVTIATNMAGRGTDIVLGGNPETMAWADLQDKYETRLDVPREEWDSLVEEISQRENMETEGREVTELGGLHVIGTERHEARRIDLQLRGRCGRQGDPGSSRFFLSMEDDLMRIFGGEWAKNMLSRIGMQEGEAIESKIVTRRIEGAQRKVEERNFEIRKNLLEYDEVMDEQRKRVYSYRQQILDGCSVRELIQEMIDKSIDVYLDEFLDKDYGTESFAKWASGLFAADMNARDFRNMDFDSAESFAKDEATRLVEGQILDSIDENLPEEEDPKEWNWGALAKMANSRWNLNIRDRDLKQAGRDGVAEMMIDRARESINEVDCSAGAKFLEPDFSLHTACAWAQAKFGLEIDIESVRHLEPEQLKETIREKAAQAYEEKESEFPVMAGLIRCTTNEGSHKRYDREMLVNWARSRFNVELEVEDLKNKQREEIQSMLVGHSREHREKAGQAIEDVHQKVDQLFEAASTNGSSLEGTPLANIVGGNGKLDSLSHWAHDTLNYEIEPDELAQLDRNQLELRLTTAVENVYRPEMRKMERALVLQILDSAWKEHLLAMDHLRSSIGLRGFAQVDPKVEFKREGMRIYEDMWDAVGERVTDLIFRMEQLDEQFVGSMWVVGETKHESPPSTSSEIGQQQQEAIQGSDTQEKTEPIRNRGPKVGRNAPCPCGSGKKYKNCCMRKGG